MNAVAWVLVCWSGVATLWWLLAVGLVRSRKVSPTPPAGGSVSARLTIFKPLPVTSTAGERAALARALESFLAQLEPGDEMLVGLPESEAPQWQPMLDEWQRRRSAPRLVVVRQSPPRQRANPKIAWLEVLAHSAQGELWLWSDADIVAPPGLLAQLKGTLATAGTGAVTCPYCVRRADAAAAMLDAAFVNAEFLPGALLLGRRGSVDFAFGAATLFRAADFRAHVNWAALGATLADDYALGQRLRPVACAGLLVETLALERTGAGALRHYYRWQKTIRWCRPGSYAALLAILPLLGWLVFAALHPANPAAWLGVGGQWLSELAAVAALCLAVRCRMATGAWLALILWPPLRALTWLAVWLPLAVTWRGARQRWSRPNGEPG